MKMSKSESGMLGAIKTKMITEKKKEKRINQYNLNPKICQCCNIAIPYKKRMNKYCSSSCAAKINNVLFQKRQSTVKINKCQCCGKETTNPKYCSNKCSSKDKNSNKFIKNKSNEYEHSLIYIKTCKCCSNEFISVNMNAQKCIKCKNTFGNKRSDLMMKRSPYFFKFNVFNYPDLFDNLDLVKQVGWYVPKTNSNGFSRDHKVSINDALNNNYDPYYITHPLNCDIIRQKENCIKRSKSSISYDELIKLVNDYDSKKA